jgi:hypothetical protein
MLTLITGLPGNGKTLYALQSVVAQAKREGREVWYHGINGLKPELGWHVIETKIEKINGREEAVPQWWLCPAKSIIVIDEAQKAGFGVRPRGQVPEWGQKLETHRHLGLDIVFITQDPSLIDAHDRKLIELHFHVMRTFGMQRAVVHEFRPVRENVLKSRKGSIEHRWSYPKQVFDWYTSAEAHTHKARVPMKVWVFLALPFIILGLSWFAWSKYLDPKRIKTSEQVAASGGAPASVRRDESAGKPVAMTPLEFAQHHTPRVEGLAYTAPVYDEVTKPVVAPYPAATVMSASKGCRAYSQQGTRLEMSQELCKRIAEGGFFVSWQQPAVAAVPVAQPVKAQEAPQTPAVTIIAGRPRMDMAPGPSPRYDGYIEQDAPANRPSRQAPG